MIKLLKKFIKNLAEENSKTFGNNRLDCCDLNKSNNSNNKKSEKNK
ncbi:LDCC motif putative metal-binding protein [Defluviitalea saccharophila]|uniref:LDCC motif putative metal-binding protein n=1 Tax=Defluviitalea saccharophila TaxID=879970 RepID=A0ABZ2YAE4_9FIRM